MVYVTVSAGDDERTDVATRGLLVALRDFPEVRSVERAGGGPPPAGARGGELLALGGLIVTTLSQPEAVGAVLKFVAERIGKRGGSVEVHLDGQVLKLADATPEQRDRLVDAFIRRVFEPGP